MFLFKNFYIIFFNFKCVNLIKYNYIYYLNFFYFVAGKSLLIPLSQNVHISSSYVVVYFQNDINVYKNYFYYLKFMFQSWERFVLSKIKYRYKGSWIYLKKRKLNSIIIEFGKSNHVYLMLFGSFYFRKKRLLAAHLFSIYGVNITELFSYAFAIRSVRCFNMYTLRGIRFSRQKFYKRVGKVSKYTMFKSKIF